MPSNVSPPNTSPLLMSGTANVPAGAVPRTVTNASVGFGCACPPTVDAGTAITSATAASRARARRFLVEKGVMGQSLLGAGRERPVGIESILVRLSFPDFFNTYVLCGR